MLRCYVGNIPFQITEQELIAFFRPHAVTNVRIVTDRETQRPRGFAFIDVADAATRDAAIRDCNGQMLGGRTIVVSVANDKPQSRAPREGGGANERRPRGDNGGGRGRRDSSEDDDYRRGWRR